MKQMQVLMPSKKLEPFIQHYFFPHMSQEYMISESSGVLEVLPSPSCSIILFFSDPSYVLRDGYQEKYCAFALIGFYRSPKRITRQSSLDQMIIRFTPIGLQLLLNFNLGEINDTFVSIENVFRSNYERLMDALYSCQNNEERVRVFEDFYSKKLNDMKSLDDRVQPLIKFINQNNGSKNVKEISKELNIGERTIQRLIHNYVGVNFKFYSQLIRFQAAINFLSNSNNEFNISDTAFTLGYFDQSHFIHDFKTFSNLTPTEYIKKHAENKVFNIPNQLNNLNRIHQQ